MSSDSSGIFSLHRYFIWADRMRVHFEASLASVKTRGVSPQEIFMEPYMSYYYAALQAVVEGWRELGLSDPAIDALLESPHIDLLRRYRNGAFHYQRTYFDDRFMDFMGAEDSAAWIRTLRDAFSRWFLEFFKRLEAEKGRVADG